MPPMSRVNLVATRCSSLITSERLLDNITPFQLAFAENDTTLLLTLFENVLGLRLMATFGEHHVMAQSAVGRSLVSSLMNNDFRAYHPLLARDTFASVDLKHQ